MITNILKILDIAKNMKAFYYYYDPSSRCLMGCDECMTYLKTIDLSDKIECPYPLFFSNKCIKDLSLKITAIGVKGITDTDIIFNDNTTFCIYYYKSVKQMKELYFRVCNYINNNEIKFNYDVLRGNEQFEHALSLKSKEGISFLKIDRVYMLSLFSGLLPVNKSDKVSLTIYSNDADFAFLSHFVIKKAKSIDVNVYVNYRKFI